MDELWAVAIVSLLNRDKGEEMIDAAVWLDSSPT